MRIEFHGYAFFICLALIILVWFLGKKYRSKGYFILILGFCGALLLPAFIPGHGEIIIALPNATLFTVFNSMAWGVGLFYLLINFFISYAVLNILRKYSSIK